MDMRWIRCGAWLVAVLTAVAGFVGLPSTALAASQPGNLHPTASSVPTPMATAFVPITPVRVVDTRTGKGAHKGRVPAGGSITITVAGVAGVPAAAQSVSLNVTSVAPAADGNLVVQTAGTPRAKTSNVNYMRGRTTAGLVYVAPSATGQVTISSSAAVDVLVDVQGYTPQGATGFRPVAPARLLDTRSGAPIAARGTRTLRVTGVAGVPSTGVEAVVLTVVGTRSAGAGYVSVFPHGGARPTVSNLNTSAGQTESVSVIVKPGVGGVVDVYSYNRTDVVVDVSGWIATNSNYVAVTPYRAMDSRGGAMYFQDSFGFFPKVPASAIAVQMNLTAVGKRGAGFYAPVPHGVAITVDSWRSLPTSAVNFTAGVTSSNATLAPIGLRNEIELDGAYMQGAAPLVDIFGYLVSPTTAKVTAQAPDVLPRSIGYGLQCFANGTCASGDLYGKVHFSAADGTWASTSLPGSPAPKVQTIACTSATSCVALGWANNIFSWDGTAWSASSSAVQTSTDSPSLSCPSANLCFLVATGHGYVSQDTKQWTAVPALDGLTAPVVACSSATHCLVTSLNGRQLAWDGSAWHGLADNAPSGIISMACGPDWCEAVTYTGGIWRNNQGVWSQQGTFPKPANSWLAPHIACTPSGLCVLSGGSVFRQFDGTRWTDATAVTAGPYAGSACSATACTTRTSAGSFVRWDGSTWSSPLTALPTWDGANHLSCPSTLFCLAGDDEGQMRIGDATGWQMIDGVPNRTTAPLGCLSEQLCFSSAGYRWDGHVWSSSGQPAGTTNSAMWCAPGVLCAVYDSAARQLYANAGQGWTRMGSALDVMSVGEVSCVSANWCMMTGISGQWATWNGRAWSSVQQGMSGDFGIYGLSCGSQTWCVAQSNAGVAAVWTGQRWTIMRLPGVVSGSFNSAQSVSCASGQSCVMSSQDTGLVSVWDGQFWSAGATAPGKWFECASTTCVGADPEQLTHFTYGTA